MSVTPQAFIQGMRQLAGGVALVTAAHGGRRVGLTATAICSVSAEPPQLLACINRQAETHDIVQRSGAFAVNLLARDQHRLAEIFAGTAGIYGEHRFDAAAWASLRTGAPVLRRCLASFDCRLVERVSAATHSIFIGRVEAVNFEPELEPLVYSEGDYGLIAPLMAAEDERA
jgi:flavin reductase (DIM6/NTAB) family NADH-FMN oxidoreductase RutF